MIFFRFNSVKFCYSCPEMNRANYRGRLAPSPTGYLHLGHARTFWMAQQRAKENGGTLVLRNEDLDSTRFKMEFVPAMIEDLRWFGFEWQEGPDCGGPFAPYNQSERMDFYRAALEKLRAGGFIYPCTCSRKDIRSAARAPHADDDEVIYPGTCRPKKVVARASRPCVCLGRNQNHTGETPVPLRIPGVSAFPMAKPFLSRTEIAASNDSSPERILATSWSGAVTAFRRINWPAWRTTRRWASPRSCAARICWSARRGSFCFTARWGCCRRHFFIARSGLMKPV